MIAGRLGFALLVGPALLQLACAPAGIEADGMSAPLPSMSILSAPPNAVDLGAPVGSTTWSRRLRVVRPISAAWLVSYYGQQLERRGWVPGVILMHDELSTQRFTRRDGPDHSWTATLAVMMLQHSSEYDVTFRFVGDQSE